MFVTVRDGTAPLVGNIIFATYPPYIEDQESILMSPLISELLFALGIYIGTVDDGFTLMERISRDPFIHNMYKVTLSVMTLPITLGNNNIPDSTRWYDMCAVIMGEDNLDVGHARLETRDRARALQHIRSGNLVVDIPYQYLRMLALLVPRFAARNQIMRIADEVPRAGFEFVFSEVCQLGLRLSEHPLMLAMV